MSSKNDLGPVWREASPGIEYRIVARNTPYTRGSPSAPSVPSLVLPNVTLSDGTPIELKIERSPNHIDPTCVTAEQLDFLAQICPKISAFAGAEWRYEHRRYVQRILDYLYIGPSVALRDLGAIERAGITMVVSVRDSRMAAWSQKSLDHAEEKLGLEVMRLDVDNMSHFLNNFPRAIHAINEHVMAVSKAATDSSKYGKVLITCESGNERSAALAVGYIMAVFGSPLTPTLHFVSVQRFCVAFTDEVKNQLKNWEDIVRARAAVARAEASNPDPSRTTKRHFDDTMDVDTTSQRGDTPVDQDRFEGRESFAPFRDMVNGPVRT
jgi:serine/threonine/tyrosine-interacting protein